jgi:histidyl-tRNA synthetase
MSDAKPYTVDELAYWESMSEALPVNHRAKLRATVESLERVTQERDSAVLEAKMTEAMRLRDNEYLLKQRDEWKRALNDALEQLRQEEHLRTTAEKERDEARVMHDFMALIGELTPESWTRLSEVQGYLRHGGPLPGAERQREACAAWVRHLDNDPDVGYTSAEILATPLVTDGGGE